MSPDQERSFKTRREKTEVLTKTAMRAGLTLPPSLQEEAKSRDEPEKQPLL